MKVLVIGGNGYIGNRLLDYLVEQQYDITIVDKNDHVSKELLEFNKNYCNMLTGPCSLRYIKANYGCLVDSFFKAFDTVVFLVNEFDFIELYHLLTVLEPHQKFIYGKFEVKDELLHKLASMIHSKYYCLNFGNLYGYSRNFKENSGHDCHINYFCEAIVIIIKRGGFNSLFDLANFEMMFSYKFKHIPSDILIEPLVLARRELNIQNTQNTQNTFNVKNCLICNQMTTSFFDIGELPIDDHYHDTDDISDTRDISLHYCGNCFHVQANGTGKVNFEFEFDNKFLYNLAIYSLTRLGYFNNHQSDFKENEQVNILIIDGKNQVEVYKFIENMWGIKFCLHTCSIKDFDQLLISSTETFDIINFFNFDHLFQLHETIGLLKQLLNKDGLMFLQSGSNINTTRSLFNGINCQRISYFSINSMKKLCTDSEMYLNNAIDIDSQYHVFEVAARVYDTNLDELLYKDITLGIYGDEYYKNFNLRMNIFRNSLQNKLYEYKLMNKTIIGYGYNGTLLNYCKIDSDILEWIIDDSDVVENLSTPITDIQIKHVNSIIGLDNIVILKLQSVNLQNINIPSVEPF
jgi:hypothetical protein